MKYSGERVCIQPPVVLSSRKVLCRWLSVRQPQPKGPPSTGTQIKARAYARAPLPASAEALLKSGLLAEALQSGPPDDFEPAAAVDMTMASYVAGRKLDLNGRAELLQCGPVSCDVAWRPAWDDQLARRAQREPIGAGVRDVVTCSGCTLWTVCGWLERTAEEWSMLRCLHMNNSILMLESCLSMSAQGPKGFHGWRHRSSGAIATFTRLLALYLMRLHEIV